jgi:hypothetical protein
MISTNQSKYKQITSEYEREVETFFNNHISSLETELEYRDAEAIQQYLKDGVFAVQYARFLSRLSSKIKFDFKKIGKEYLEEQFGNHDDYLDTVIRFTKDVDRFYIQQEQLAIKNSPVEIDRTSAITKGVSTGVLTTALTYSLAALVFRAPFVITSLVSVAFGTGLGGKVYKRKLIESMAKAKQKEKEEIIKQLAIGLEECKQATLNNISYLLVEYNKMFREFLEGFESNAISAE